MPHPSTRDALGVWIFGALGGLATTVIVGARGAARELAKPLGMLTETEFVAGLPLAPLSSLVFGGHEIRSGTLMASANEIQSLNGTIPLPLLQALRGDLAKISRQIRPGSLCNAGASIRELATTRHRGGQTMRAEIERLQRDIRQFMRRNRLARCICVNLTSTEAPLALSPAHRTPQALERAIDRNEHRVVRPSTLYAYVAASLGLPLVHFTPANATLLPAIRAMFDARGTPYMGADGKTGETLVKSALAPMFKYRNLQVLSWQGYNILGDRDGVVLSDPANRASKVATKDGLLPRILGYPLHTHVGIDYVPSLHDLKTAWDFVHFQGFLGYKMSMQFTWQGCDAILAAPLVLDLVRFLDLAQRRGESGAQKHLACFFKRPLDVDEHDLHQQWHMLTDYVRAAAESSPASSKRRQRPQPPRVVRPRKR